MSSRCPACGAEGNEPCSPECEWVGNTNSPSYRAARAFVVRCIDDGLAAAPEFGDVRRDLVLTRVGRIRDRIAVK